VVIADELAARYTAPVVGVHRYPEVNLCTCPVNPVDKDAATRSKRAWLVFSQ
jgi:hypothetical protein